MVSASKAKREAKKQAAGKTPTSKLSSKANSKAASKANSENGDAVELDAHGNPIQSDEPATGADKMEAVEKLKNQIDKFGVSRCPLRPLGSPPTPMGSPQHLSRDHTVLITCTRYQIVS